MLSVKTAPEATKLPLPVVGLSTEKLSSRKISIRSEAMPDGSESSKVDRPMGQRTQSIASDGTGGRSKSEYCEGSLQLEQILECQRDVMCVRFNQSGTLLAAGLADGQIRIYNVDGGQCVHILTSDDYSKKRLPVTSIRFCPSPTEGDTGSQRSNMLMATYTTGHVRFWHFTSNKCLQTINELRQSGQTLSSAFNPSASHLVTVGADPQIYLYDVNTKQRINSLEATDSRYKMDGHRCRVFSVQYHAAEPTVFLSGGWDDTVQFWDERARHAFRFAALTIKIYGPHICGDALDIDPLHGHILTGSWRKEAPLQIWDYGSGDKIRDVPEDLLNPSLLYSAQWLGKESIICGGNSKNLARVIDRSTLNSVGQLVELPQGVYCIDNDRQGSRPRVAVGAGKKIYFLRTLPGFSLQPK